MALTVASDLVKAAPITVQNGGRFRELLPTPTNHVRVPRIEFHDSSLALTALTNRMVAYMEAAR